MDLMETEIDFSVTNGYYHRGVDSIKRYYHRGVDGIKREIKMDADFIERFARNDKLVNGNKRRKVGFQDHEFKPGYIVRVKVKNFVTYAEGEFNLSPLLNMIIGPNGTGKSTVVAAICLGLGGKVDLIKRKNMKSMIKTGETKSTIEITLKNEIDKPSLVIRREFTEKESVWSINDRPATESKIKDIRRKFNIQLDNLCHFLPQERVAEFAGLSPEKLLLETERTLGDGHLLEAHQSLIDMDNESQDLLSNIDDIESKLDQLLQEKRSLEEEAKRFEEYEKKLRQIDLHKKLIPYAQLLDLKKHKDQLQRDIRAAKEALSTFDSRIQPTMQQVESYREEVEAKTAIVTQLKHNQVEITSRVENAKKDLNAIMDSIDSIKSNIETWKKRSTESKQLLQRLKNEKLSLEQQLTELESVDEDQFDELRTALQHKNSEKNAILSTIERIDSEAKGSLSNVRRLGDRMEDIKRTLKGSDRLALLDPANSSYSATQKDIAFNSHLALRKESSLKGHYFECPIICCSVTDKDYSKHLEKVVDNNTLFSITTSSQDNFEKIRKFSETVRINFPIRLSLTRDIPTPSVRVEAIKKFGFDGYLSDFVTGPKEVLHMLYDISKIHNIPVSKAPFTSAQIQKLLEPNDRGMIPFMKFIAGNVNYSIQRSRYGQKQIFYVAEEIEDAKYFNASGLTSEARANYNTKLRELSEDEQKERKICKEFSERINEAKEKQREIQRQMEALVNQIDTMKHLKKRRVALETKIANKSDEITKTIRVSKKNYSERIEKAKEEINSRYKESSLKVAKINEYIKELAETSVEMNLKSFELLDTRNRELHAKKSAQSLENERKELEIEYHRLKEELNKIKKGDAVKQIEEQGRNYTEEERNELAELAQRYKDNDELTERNVREKISILEDEKSVMATADQSSIETLRKKLNEIENANRELPILKTNKERLDERIKGIQLKWETELSNLVNQISLSFNKRFTKVASDGRVELSRAERFKDWKLQILVKFREESELKILDHQSQSGGERAVSTIFFIMSLQGLTDAPFRVVDEINQGMDPKNEKMAHRYFVHTACQNQNSQYFLVTPKLLTGLYYHPNMMVHCIYTGPLIEAPVDEIEDAAGFMDFTKIY